MSPLSVFLMPFGPITANAKTFNQSGDGRYMLSTVTFGQPANYFQVKGGSPNKDRSNITAAVSRILEKDVTVNSVTSRRQAIVQNIITIPIVGFTSLEIDGLTSDLDVFFTQGVLDRLLNGES